jgi:hypothetical protein
VCQRRVSPPDPRRWYFSAVLPGSQVLPAAAGLTITGIRSVTEEAVGPPKGAAGFGGAGGPGIAPGELGVSARAQVTFDVTR